MNGIEIENITDDEIKWLQSEIDSLHYYRDQSLNSMHKARIDADRLKSLEIVGRIKASRPVEVDE